MRKSLSLYLILAVLGGLIGGWLEARTPRQVGQYGEGLSSAQTSPDGRKGAGLRNDGGERWSVTVWDTQTGKPLWGPQPIPHPPGTTTPLAWSEDGRWLAAASSDRVNLFDGATGKGRVLAANWLVREVRFSGPWLMARADGGVYVWDTQSGRQLQHISQSHLLAAALDASQKVLATASLDDSIRLFSLPEGKSLGSLPEGGGAVPTMNFVHSGQWLVSGHRFSRQRSQDCVMIYDWRHYKAHVPKLAQPDLVGFDVSPDGSRVVSRSHHVGTVWNGQSGAVVRHWNSSSLQCESISPDGRLLAGLPESEEGVVVTESDSGRPLGRLQHPRRPSQFRFFGAGLQVLHGSCSLWQFPGH